MNINAIISLAKYNDIFNNIKTYDLNDYSNLPVVVRKGRSNHVFSLKDIPDVIKNGNQDRFLLKSENGFYVLYTKNIKNHVNILEFMTDRYRVYDVSGKHFLDVNKTNNFLHIKALFIESMTLCFQNYKGHCCLYVINDNNIQKHLLFPFDSFIIEQVKVKDGYIFIKYMNNHNNNPTLNFILSLSSNKRIHNVFNDPFVCLENELVIDPSGKIVRRTQKISCDNNTNKPVFNQSILPSYRSNNMEIFEQNIYKNLNIFLCYIFSKPYILIVEKDISLEQLGASLESYIKTFGIPNGLFSLKVE